MAPVERNKAIKGMVLAVLVGLPVLWTQFGDHSVEASEQSASSTIEPAPAQSSSGPAGELGTPTTKDIGDYPLVSQASAMSAKQDGIAMLINLSGELCAKTVSAEPRRKEGTFTVICETRRSGTGVARYVLDATNGKARRI